MTDSMIDVLIVGAGPYGLSVAAHLRELDVPTRVIGTPMRFWDANMPAGMFLKSEPFASNVGSPAPGAAFTDYAPGWRSGRPIPNGMFVAYGRWFAERRVPHTEAAEVVDVEHAGGAGYTVTLSTGETVAARAVVIAVGVGGFAHVPDELAGLPAELASHSVAHRDLDRFAGQTVAVVGAGQSALETAVLLADAGARPHLLARTGELAWNAVPQPDLSRTGLLMRGPRSGLGRGWRTWVWAERPWAARLLPDGARQRVVAGTLPPAGSWWLRDRLDDRVGLTLGRRLAAASAQDGRAVVSTLDQVGSTHRFEADHVIAATGFVCDLDRIAILSPEIRHGLRRRHASPALDTAFQSSLPGLYFAGFTAAATFGPVMRFVHGSGFAGRRVARHIARHIARNRRSGPPPLPAAVERSGQERSGAASR
ncbi:MULTISPECIES: NAD(P)-binding domain-containing protein [Thermomonosporaceae]|uniref:NAD(P)-binding domain-containing protein n=1 Tax=Thermomonosporaceae TaxID=2012 RepID=UPI00255A90BD|nr:MULTISPECIES: NAD(P)-binding domain-containing protein [Thermomonosporaceae]MDL4773209.1 NAD(P)-binding domain-containing protein [Actinomadura xylanilytica]